MLAHDKLGTFVRHVEPSAGPNPAFLNVDQPTIPLFLRTFQNVPFFLCEGLDSSLRYFCASPQAPLVLPLVSKDSSTPIDTSASLRPSCAKRSEGGSKDGFQTSKHQKRTPMEQCLGERAEDEVGMIDLLGCVSALTPITLLLPGCCYSTPRLHVFRLL